MDMERCFSLAGDLVLPGWLLLIFAPRWRYSARFIAPVVIPGILSVAYLTLFAMNSSPADFSNFSSLAGVKSLFQIDALLLAGWIHYLAFDLFIGSWEVRDAQSVGVPHLLVVPCLVLTFMLGPVGLLSYLALRAALRRRWMIDDPVNHATLG
jgi:hypothetical protein